MYKRLRIVVSAAQVIAFAAVFVWKLSFKIGATHFDYFPMQELIWKVNYPIWVFLLAIAYPIDHISSHLPTLMGWYLLPFGIILAALVLASVAVLWYFVGTEIEQRIHGKSLLRFSGRFKELLSLSVLLVLGGNALRTALTYRTSVNFLYSQATWLTVIAASEAFLGRLILIIWGFGLLGFAIHDVKAILKSGTISSRAIQ